MTIDYIRCIRVALLMCAITGPTHAIAETWECVDRTADGWGAIEIVARSTTNSSPASIEIGGSRNEAVYRLEDSDHQWLFSDSVFVLDPNDGGLYYASGSPTAGEPTARYRCRLRRARASRGSAASGNGLATANLTAAQVNERIESWKTRHSLGNTFIDAIGGTNSSAASTWRNCVSLERLGAPPYSNNERKRLLTCLYRYMPVPVQ